MGEGIFLLVILALFVFLVVPILSVVAAVRASSLHNRLSKVESELARLRAGDAAKHAGSLASKPEAAQDPAPARETQPVEPEPLALEAAKARITPDPQPPTQPSRSQSAHVDWERRIAANWMVWVGGVALALGGLFLVRVAIEAGLFGPAIRTGLAAVLGIGLVAASFRAKALKAVQTAKTAVRHLPTVLAAAGVTTLFGATLAAGVLYGLLPPAVIFVLFAVIAVLAVALAWIYGPTLAGLGLVGAYIGPFFTGAEGGSPLTLLPYAFIITAGALAIIRLREWAFVSWLALAGAMLWGMLCLVEASVHASWAVPLYALALAGCAGLFGEKHARAALAWRGEVAGPHLRQSGEPFFVAHLFWIGAAVLLVWQGVETGLEGVTGPALSLFAGMGLFATWRRQGYALLVLISALTALALLGLWRSWNGIEPVFAASLSVLFAGMGWILLPRLKVQTPVALVSALFAPCAFLIAAWRMEGFDPGPIWAFASLFLAAGNIVLIEGLSKRDPGFETHPGTGALYGFATSIFLSMGAVFALSGLWLGTGIALVSLSLALLYRRFELWLLRRGAVVAGAVSVVLLLRPDLLSSAAISTFPVFNALSLSILPAMAALFAAGWLLSAHEEASRALRSMTAFLGFALVGLLIRHASGGGSLTGPNGGLSEAAGYAVTYLGGAAGLFWRNPKGIILNLMRWAGLAVGAMALFMGLAALEWDSALGWPVFNLLLPMFAMPALLLALIGLGQRRARLPVWGKTMSIAAMALGLLWALLETRRLFVGPDLFGMGTLTDAQMWTYSATLVIYALALLMLGTLRSAQLPRFASLAILATAIFKVFIFDLGALDGALRAASFIGLGTTLLGTALFYQRFVFTRARPAASPDLDAS